MIKKREVCAFAILSTLLSFASTDAISNIKNRDSRTKEVIKREDLIKMEESFIYYNEEEKDIKTYYINEEISKEEIYLDKGVLKARKVLYKIPKRRDKIKKEDIVKIQDKEYLKNSKKGIPLERVVLDIVFDDVGNIKKVYESPYKKETESANDKMQKLGYLGEGRNIIVDKSYIYAVKKSRDYSLLSIKRKKDDKVYKIERKFKDINIFSFKGKIYIQDKILGTIEEIFINGEEVKFLKKKETFKKEIIFSKDEYVYTKDLDGKIGYINVDSNFKGDLLLGEGYKILSVLKNGYIILKKDGETNSKLVARLEENRIIIEGGFDDVLETNVSFLFSKEELIFMRHKKNSVLKSVTVNKIFSKD